VHRDIKPSNILVTPDDRYLVFDFGIAKPLRVPDSTTDKGFVVGTPEFMSPEQCRGDRIDQRSDIYSLGVMAYQLLTGQVPFRAQSAVGVLMKHLTAPFPTSDKLTPELNQVLNRAMARSPEDRYSSARELNDELHRAAGHQPTVTIVAKTIRQPLWKRWAYRAQQIPRRSLAFGGGITLALGLSLGGVFLGYQALSPSNDPPNTSALSEVWVTEQKSPLEAASQPADESIQPAPQPDSGFLFIESDQPASVILDGKFIGNAPGEFKSLPPGNHRLKLNGSHDVSWEKDISIYAASTTYVKMAFPDEGNSETPRRVTNTKSTTENTVFEERSSAKAERPKPTPAEPIIRQWKGYLTDEQCREKGGQEGELHLKSALRCIREGWRPMLYTENQELFYLENFERIRLRHDAPLVFRGWLDRKTNTIHVVH
jgi:serine/threonine protein kinase